MHKRIQFFTMETTLNRRNCQYRTTQSPRSHVSDTGHTLMRTITGRCHFSPPCLQLRRHRSISGLEYWELD
ncbi:hypothetical protein R3I93_015634 [Phoxinus phoxinus]|uniref:Uncharacterized protein n=1 Tax=Phoxinus phoxinus TaxID=58324 RepID=A0AAN9CPE8_9TELE